MDVTKIAAADAKRVRGNSKKSSYTGIRIGGKKYDASKGFGQFKTKPAGKKTTAGKLRGGIGMAIL